MINNDSLSQIINDLYLFYRVFIVSRFKKNLPAKHIRTLSRALMRIYTGDLKRLVVNMGPQHSKSSMVTLAYPLWLIFLDPDTNILIVNNSANLSEKFGIELREYIREYGSFFNVYLSDVKHAKNYLMFCDKDGQLYNGSIRLLGAGASNITGTSVDYLIMDDVYAGFEDITPSLLEKKLDWFKTIILQRLREHTKLIILHTRWHTNDISGYLKEHQANDYEFIEFPAILSDGTPLWPEAYSIETLQKRRQEMGERLFQSIYQQQPLDMSSCFFNMDKINYGLPVDYNPERTIRCYDIAASEDSSSDPDYTVGIKAAKSGDDLVILDMVRGRFGSSNHERIKETALADGPYTKIFIEFGTSMTSKQLLPFYKQVLIGYNVEAIIPLKSKEDRATPLQNKIFDGELYINLKDNTLNPLIKELSSFPLGLHDDIVDSLSYCCNKLFVPDSQPDGRIGVVQL